MLQAPMRRGYVPSHAEQTTATLRERTDRMRTLDVARILHNRNVEHVNAEHDWFTLTYRPLYRRQWQPEIVEGLRAIAILTARAAVYPAADYVSACCGEPQASFKRCAACGRRCFWRGVESKR